MKSVYLILLSVLISCSEKPIDLELSAHTNQKLVVEAGISPLFETQHIHCSLTSQFGADSSEAITDASIKVYTDEGIYTFTHTTAGTYASDLSFAGIPGQKYLIEVIHNAVLYTAETVMPSPVSILGTSVYNGFEKGILDYIQVDIASEANQYFFYKVSKAELDSAGTDTLWTLIETPIYWVAPLVAAPTQTKRFYAPNNYQLFGPGDVLRIEVYAVSNDIGEYLLSLRDYVQKELPNSQFHNPPAYYSPDAYGLGYGYCADTTLFYW